MRGIEPLTPSLPWKCSTPELHRLLLLELKTKKSGRRDSNPRPSAWKADALPTELHPLKKINIPNLINLFVGVIGIEPIQT
jgi:hypothetical protein